jgi:dCMP deaminase
MTRFVGRISKHEMFMQMAEITASRSTCQRRHVGALVTDAEGYSVLALGYNGNAKGLDNNCDRETPGDCGCIHAEVNTLIKSPFYQGDLIMYTTTYPCIDCAKLILNSRVRTIYYREDYREDTGIKLLLAQGLKVYFLTGFEAVSLIDVNGRLVKITEAGQEYRPNPELQRGIDHQA